MSYILLPHADVIKLCKRTLNAIDGARKEEVDSRIKYYMTPTKLFGFTVSRGMTYDEAKNYVMNESKQIDDLLAVEKHFAQYNRVKEILKLAEYGKHQPGLFTLTVDDMSYLITK